jgi:hypothetical protein
VTPIQEPGLFDSDKLRVAEAILREFQTWHNNLPVGQRDVVAWHKHRIDEYFADPQVAEDARHWRTA